MQYSRLVELFDKLLTTTKKLEKRDMLAEFLRSTPRNLLKPVVLMLTGAVYPPAEERDLGIAIKMMIQAIHKATGASEKEIITEFKKTGDLGTTTENLILVKKQKTFGKKELDVKMVFDSIRSLADATGKGSQEKKLSIISEILAHARPAEAKYIVRIIIGNMRTGAAEGILRDAIAKAFEVGAKDVEEAYNTLTDYGEVALVAATHGKKGLDESAASLPVGKPIRSQLAEKSENLEEAMKAFEHCAVQTKYDGFRVQIHKDGDKIWVFSRRLEDVTRQFPDIAEVASKNLHARQCIVEGEALAVSRSGKPLPFQQLSQRIQRKYEIEKMIKEVPVRVHIFDCLFADGKILVKAPLSERWGVLGKILTESENFKLAEQVITKDADKANSFYQKSLKSGQEGVMVKNLNAHYQPGKRVGFWLKVKPMMETLDLVVVGAEWGEGKRAKWLSSYILAARGENGNLKESGRMASGLTEEQLEEMTKQLRPLITKELGKIVEIKPKIVLEVGYEEIQKSPKYPSGFALRFPRLVRFRPDRSPEDCDTVERIAKLYSQQRGRKK